MIILMPLEPTLIAVKRIINLLQVRQGLKSVSMQETQYANGLQSA